MIKKIVPKCNNVYHISKHLHKISSPSSFSLSSAKIVNNKNISNLFTKSSDPSSLLYNKFNRYQSTASTTPPPPPPPINKNNNKKSDHEHLDSLEDSLVNHNQEEFQRAPKFFWIGVGVLLAGVIVKIGSDYLFFNQQNILDDINTILNNENPLERNEALVNILMRSPMYHSIEKLFENGIVDVLVKSLSDSDPTVQATAIRALQEFIARGYEVFGEEAVKKGASSTVAKTMLLRGMNCEAATNLWFAFINIKTNHEILLSSDEFIKNLNQLAHSESLYLQEVAVETFKILFSNRENYTLLPRIRGVINHLHKSKNVLISNYCEQFLGVLNGSFIPPVGTTNSKHKEMTSYGLFRLHLSYNALMAPLAYLYCSYRWGRYTNDSIYKNAKGVTGAIAILIAGTMASISLYPHYHSKKIDNRLREQLAITKERASLAQIDDKAAKDISDNQDAASKVPDTVSTYFTKFKSSIFSPNSLFAINQLFPIVGNVVLISAWRNSRFIFLPAMAILLPYCLEMQSH